MIGFGADKRWLGEVFSLSQDALHVHVGLLLFFAAHVLLRRRPGSALPVLVVLLVATFGEALDMNRLAGQGVFDPWGSVHDILNTTIWPVLLTLGFRWWRRRSAAVAAVAATSADASGQA